MLKPDLADAADKLIVYGSLAPGEDNYILLADLPGTWEKCSIRGRMGSFMGFKSFRIDPGGEEHPAWLFISPGLPARFPALDDFEGEAYQRVVIQVQIEGRRVWAHIYEGIYVD